MQSFARAKHFFAIIFVMIKGAKLFCQSSKVLKRKTLKRPANVWPAKLFKACGLGTRIRTLKTDIYLDKHDLI